MRIRGRILIIQLNIFFAYLIIITIKYFLTICLYFLMSEILQGTPTNVRVSVKEFKCVRF